MAEGYKAWNSGDILNAADLNDYASSQAVMRFANAAGRDAALTSLIVKEGMVAYLKDTNILTINTDGTTTGWREVSPAEASSIKDGSVTLAKLASNSVDSSKIVDGSIVNADISASAAIDLTKLTGSWISWTPTWTVQNQGTVTLGAFSYAYYYQIGDIVSVIFELNAGSTISNAGEWRISLPTGQAVPGVIGVGFYRDPSSYRPCHLIGGASTYTTFRPSFNNPSSNVNSSVTSGWQVGGSYQYRRV